MRGWKIGERHFPATKEEAVNGPTKPKEPHMTSLFIWIQVQDNQRPGKSYNFNFNCTCCCWLLACLLGIGIGIGIGHIKSSETIWRMLSSSSSTLLSGIKPPVGVKALYAPNPTHQSSSSMAAPAPKWSQKTITLPPHRRGCHLVTPKILKEIGQDLSGFNCGLAHLFLQHTSASLTINENYDSDVRDDTETFLNKIVPEGRSAPWKHTLEGPDDMPAHIKSSMFGCTLTIPITNGQLNMGTWQGIWLCEHRDAPTARKVVVTLNGI